MFQYKHRALAQMSRFFKVASVELLAAVEGRENDKRVVQRSFVITLKRGIAPSWDKLGEVSVYMVIYTLL